jgi:hypothetical protein
MPSTLELDSKDKRAITMGFECCWAKKHIDNVHLENSLKSIEFKSKVNLNSLQFTPFNNNSLYIYYTLQFLDVYTTWKGLSNSSNIRETNPILGPHPNLSQILALKLLADQFIEPPYLSELEFRIINSFMTAIVINNLQVLNKENISL